MVERGLEFDEEEVTSSGPESCIGLYPKSSPNSTSALTAGCGLDIETDVAFAGKLEESRGSCVFHAIDEL